MPMFEYQCRACQTRFERLSWNAEEAGTAPRCPCGSTEVERIWYSRVAVGHAEPGATAGCSDSCACEAGEADGDYGCGEGACGYGPN